MNPEGGGRGGSLVWKEGTKGGSAADWSIHN